MVANQVRGCQRHSSSRGSCTGRISSNIAKKIVVVVVALGVLVTIVEVAVV